MSYGKLRVIISGGGTGGHIFPAISIARELLRVNPETELLFVGAEGRMEMEKVPAAGFRIVGLPVVGLQRRFTPANVLNNILLPFKVAGSIRKAGRIIREFKPDVAVGVGGYASAPLLYAAARRGIRTLIQEQNGFAGLTNRILSSRVEKVCVAYEGMERFFPADKIVVTGNPIRPEMHPFSDAEKAEGLRHYGLDPGCRQLLIVGGSLGSGTLNEAVKNWILSGCPGGEGIELLWQCGKYYKNGIDEFMRGRDLPRVHYSDFIARMDLAYAAADLVVSRSGASSISEICATHKAAVFVPSPNVAEDHQTHNAMALVRRDAALLVKDSEAVDKLLGAATELLRSPERIEKMERNVAPLALPGAARAIVDEIYKLV